MEKYNTITELIKIEYPNAKDMGVLPYPIYKKV